MKFSAIATILCSFAGLVLGQATPNYTSPLGVEIYNPDQSFEPSGPWSLMTKAGNTLYISGMRGFYPSNTTLAPIGLPRVQQAFANMKQLAELGGTNLELWKDVAPNYPARSIIEVQRLNDDDIVEVEGTFYLGD
ncbi:hypothetical protein N0V90_009327 [Kalmusia sp. IMI 367209]|nr:hypothetical protein N0V90_009327 [Kalmusia sp. IMI 367209]